MCIRDRVYALCFYRARITVLRIVLANLVVNLLVNALMGSLWNLMLRGGVYWGWFLPSLGKNLVTVLPKTLVIYVPVSYTHLDVYKRQGLGHGTGAGLQEVKEEQQRSQEHALSQEGAGGRPAQGEQEEDVYKRQGRRKRSRFRSRRRRPGSGPWPGTRSKQETFSFKQISFILVPRQARAIP